MIKTRHLLYTQSSGSWSGCASVAVLEMSSLAFLLVCMAIISCVLSTGEQFGRIVHGVEVKQGGLPYQASVQMKLSPRSVTRKSLHFCGGAFITANWVLTAAHCVRGEHARNLQVVGGTADISDRRSQAFLVTRIIMNKYNHKTKMNDIALIHVQKTSNQDRKNHKIIPVKLCEETFEPHGYECKVSGWGHLNAQNWLERPS